VSLTSVDITVLDNPAWCSLTGPHARFAQSVGRAHRYHPDISIFVGMPDDPDDQAWSDLATLVGPGAQILINGDQPAAPDGWELLFSGNGVQMIDVAVDAVPDDEAIVLGIADAEEMADLVERAKPGPWRPRTYELGTYLGIRRNGRLVAMAGERLQPTGWTEISAVCTDESYRGQGLAGRLVQAVAYTIRSRGDKVLLHAAITNTNAIRLYEKLGFEVRRETTFVAYSSPK
jgi:ribosomal protein S18 acetylase RimI-like enzyme